MRSGFCRAFGFALLLMGVTGSIPARAQNDDAVQNRRAMQLLLDLAQPSEPSDGRQKDCPPNITSVRSPDCVEFPPDGSVPEKPERPATALPRPFVLPSVFVDLINQFRPETSREDVTYSGPRARPENGPGNAGPRQHQTFPASTSSPNRPGLRPPLAGPPPSQRRLASQSVSGPHVPDEVLILVTGGEADALEIALANNLEIRSLRASALLGATIVRFGISDNRPVARVLGQLVTDQRVAALAPNHLFTIQQSAGPPQFALAKLSLDTPALSLGEGARIAIIDTAVDDTVAGLNLAIVASFDALEGIPVTARKHGTSIAALIAGRGAVQGIVPAARLLIARAFDVNRDGETLSSTDAILASLDWAWQQGANVVNMSFAGPNNRLVELGCQIASQQGMHLVAAAGNNGPSAPYSYPAAHASVMAVTAIDADDRVMKLANSGPYILYSAPGVDLIAPVPGGLEFVTGTSFSAALVSGIAAAVHESRNGISPRLLKQRLSTGIRDLGKPGRDETYGLGLIDATAALR